jgi:type I restriction enzyme S subunit
MGLTPGNQVHPRFLFFWMQTVDLTRLAHDSGAVPSIRKTEMAQLQIPVPPLEEQARIVAILDQFDALVNDLSIGLPAEIKARRQQYEYYRDRLLSFKEAA